MSEQPTINVRAHLTMKDLVPAVMALSLRRYRWGIAVLEVLVAVGIVRFWMNGHTVAENLDLLATMIVFPTVIAYVASFATARSYLKNTPTAQGEHSYSFSEDGIDITGPHSQGKIRWSGFTGSWETRKAFFVYLDKARALVIPKRFFVVDSDVPALRGLLRKQLPKSQLKEQRPSIRSNRVVLIWPLANGNPDSTFRLDSQPHLSPE